MMRNRLCQTDLLSHAFAIASDVAMCCRTQVDSGKSLRGHRRSLVGIDAVQSQTFVHKIPSCHAAREVVELGAVTDVAKEGICLRWRETENTHTTTGRLYQAS